MEEVLTPNHVTNAALRFYSKLNGRKLNGDLDGNLVVKLPNATLIIFNDGEGITYVPLDITEPTVWYQKDQLGALSDVLTKTDVV